MTGPAAGFSVFAEQRETGLVVLEIGHAILAIMTGLALATVVGNMLLHKTRVVIGMAVLAGLRYQPEISLERMAFLAAQQLIVIPNPVPGQAEACALVVEASQPRETQVELSALVLAMAEVAWLSRVDQAVCALAGLALEADLRMAVQAKCILPGSQWCMAQAAALLKILVGGITTERLTGQNLCAQFTGCESLSAVIPREERQTSQEDSRQDQAG